MTKPAEKKDNSDTYTATGNGGVSTLVSESTLLSLKELGDVLGGIHKRLLSEGYILKEGRFVKNDDQ